VQQHGGQVGVIRAMTGCLDLLQMSRSRSNDAYMQAGPGHLRVLAKWARHSVSSVPVGNGETIEREHDGIELPADEVLIGEFGALADALYHASQQRQYQAWSGAVSSTTVMAVVLTQPKFYSIAPNYLYLFQHCALKGVPEAVVEGMGCVWDSCAMPGRHLSFEAGAQEAVVCWNAPRPYHPECDAFLARALTRYFEGGRWHFTHSCAETKSRTEQSKVAQKLRGRAQRLPGSVWT